MSAAPGYYVRVICGAWHPDLRQTWGPPPACKLDLHRTGMHYAIHIGPAGRQAVAWWDAPLAADTEPGQGT